MKALTKDQLCSVLAACEYYKTKMDEGADHMQTLQTLQSGIDKLRDNLRGRIAQEQRRVHRVDHAESL